MIGSDLNEKYDHLVAELARLSAAMETFEFPRSDQQPSPQYKEWEPFVEYNAATTDGSGGATVEVPVTARGWEAFVHRVSVTVQGSSSSASVTNYRGGVADTNLFDYASAMFGNSPSRVVGGYIDGEYFEGQPVNVVVAGAAASQQVVVRVAGRRRQIQTTHSH